jgi:hypothetical protein
MRRPKKRLNIRDALRYSKQSRSTVRRFYAAYRVEQALSRRCDNPECHFHTSELRWNERDLPLILDHINGVNRDNRPENLRHLCPNCDALLNTRGGRSKGRVEMAESGFAIRGTDGRRHFSLPAETGEYQISGVDATLNHDA